MHSEQFDQGKTAKTNGQGYNMNPYNPEDEAKKFEDWMDGWSSITFSTASHISKQK